METILLLIKSKKNPLKRNQPRVFLSRNTVLGSSTALSSVHLRLHIQRLPSMTPLYSNSLKKTPTITTDDLSGILIYMNQNVFASASRFCQLSIHEPRSCSFQQCSPSSNTPAPSIFNLGAEKGEEFKELRDLGCNYQEELR